MVGAEFDVTGDGRSLGVTGRDFRKKGAPACRSGRETRHVIPDALRPVGWGGKRCWCWQMGALSSLSETAQSSQVCKSVNLGAQEVEAALTRVGTRGRDAFRYMLLCFWAEDSEPECWLVSFLAVPPAPGVVESL